MLLDFPAYFSFVMYNIFILYKSAHHLAHVFSFIVMPTIF